MEPEEFPFLRFHIGLKKFFIRPFLNLNEIRKVENFLDLGKVLSVSSVDGNNHCHVDPSRMEKGHPLIMNGSAEKFEDALKKKKPPL